MMKTNDLSASVVFGYGRQLDGTDNSRGVFCGIIGILLVNEATSEILHTLNAGHFIIGLHLEELSKGSAVASDENAD